MKTTRKNPTAFKELNEFCEILIKNGFNVYVKPEMESWVYIEKSDKIGYIQYEKFRGFNFSTVHKPNRETGTGYSCQGYLQYVTDPTIENALETFKGNQHPSVIKYKDIEEFKKSSNFNKDYILLNNL